MRNYTCLCYEYVFGDHFAKVSDKAKLYYIQIQFFANNGFVPNPLQVLDLMGYDKGVLQELINNGELLTIPDRCEVFITAFFLHNKGLQIYSWKNTPYAVYWENRLRVKKNGIVDFDPDGLKPKESKTTTEPEVEKPTDNDNSGEGWDDILNSIDAPKNQKAN